LIKINVSHNRKKTFYLHWMRFSEISTPNHEKNYQITKEICFKWTRDINLYESHPMDVAGSIQHRKKMIKTSNQSIRMKILSWKLSLVKGVKRSLVNFPINFTLVASVTIKIKLSSNTLNWKEENCWQMADRRKKNFVKNNFFIDKQS
jgi:hypothetical protein